MPERLDLCWIEALSGHPGSTEAAGSTMNRSQQLLVNLGMSSPELDRLIRSVSRHSYGAKLTGFGGGGCMVALARDPEAAAAAIGQAGGRATVLKLAREGIRPDD